MDINLVFQTIFFCDNLIRYKTVLESVFTSQIEYKSKEQATSDKWI